MKKVAWPPAWVVLTLLFVGGLILAFSGAFAWTSSISDSLYLVSQMIVANGSFPPLKTGTEVNWQLQVSRLLLPIVAAYTTIRFVISLGQQKITLFRLKFLQKHIVFLGAGRVASAIVSGLHRVNPDQRIIALDISTSSTHIQYLKETCCVQMIEGDATDRSLLERLNLSHAKAIYIFTGHDQRDLDILFEVVRMIPLNGDKPDIYTDVDDRSLVRAANLSNSLCSYQKAGGRLRWFSCHALSARALFLKHSPKPEPSSDQVGPVHVGVVGFGTFAQEIVLQAIRHCVYVGEKPISISIFAHSQFLFEQFLLRYPVLDSRRADLAYGGLTPLANIQFFELDLTAPSPAVVRAATTEHPLSVVYVAGETDQDSQIASFRFRQALVATEHASVQTVCCLPGTHYIDLEQAVAEQRASDKNGEFYENITLFHTTSAFLGRKESSPGSDADRIGIHVDAAYRAHSEIEKLLNTVADQKNTLPVDQEMTNVWDRLELAIQSEFVNAAKEWETRLSEDFRWSSRHCGDHLFVKLSELGFSLQAGDGGVADSVLEDLRAAIESRMEDLKRMEHRRFCLERLLDGWLFFKNTRRETELNKTLLPFDLLPSTEKKKDEVIIRAIPVILRDHEISGRYTLSEL